MSDETSAAAAPVSSAGSEPPLESPHRLSDRVRGLGCPSCGGGLDVRTGLRVVTCPYCATPLLALSEVGTRRYAVEPQVDADRARRLARAWLAKGISKDPKLEKEAEVGEAFLTFLPFYRVQADCVGIALGTEERKRTVGTGKNRRTETYEVDVERRVEKSFDRTYPAVNVAEWGIRRVDLRGDPLVPFDARLLDRLGMVFPTTGSESRVRQAALEQYALESDPASGLKRVRFRFHQTLRDRLSVVYYPLWVVRYRFRERAYQILVDGEDGSIAYGKAPGNDFYRAAILVGVEAAAAFVFTTVLQLGVECGPALFLGAICGGAVLWAWNRFRYGGVVIEGTGTAPELGLVEVLGRAAKSRSPWPLLSLARTPRESG